MKPFDLLKAPLQGKNLIEASAGTGKTYHIEGLFVRLVLESGLSVDQILVLTFTNAATEELKIRIRSKLIQAQDGFAIGRSPDPLVESLLKTYTDHEAARMRLYEALIDFDQAAIFTIHGFCQRIIHEHAFEAHSLFDTELVSNQSSLLQEVVDDFWREIFYSAPPEWIGYALNETGNPEYFVKLLNKVKTSDLHVIPEFPKPALEALGSFRNALKNLKKAWPASREQVIQALSDPGLNATVYGRLNPAAGHTQVSERDLRVIALAEAMDRLTQPRSTGFPLFKKFENFTTAKLTKATKKTHRTPEHDFFVLCDSVYRQGERLGAEFEQALIHEKARLFVFAAAELGKRKKAKNIQYFDDLLLTVQRVLKGENGQHLAGAARQRYRAALVDEFQDTDSLQYDILTRLFDHEDGLLFMIGDPKQSIYSFRGADIFAYMKAARNTTNRFTLLNNWRSEPKLITAVNTLFSGANKPFVFDAIPFEAGRPAPRDPCPPGFDGPPLTLWHLDSKDIIDSEKPINKPAAVRLIAAAVGGEISRLLSKPNPIEPANIAVLVRTNDQAQLMKDVLTARNVPSVLYTAANIFDSREAMEIELLLSAIAYPSDVHRIKAALATDIMGVRARDLITDNHESRRWETRLARFREYFEIWQQTSFIRMFRLLLVREQIKDRLLGYPDGERRLTNILHLLELLHRQSAEKKTGIAGLLKWLAEQRDPSTPRLEENQLRLESDENAVKIVTIHKSKGLEYPIVFCPFGWEGSLISDREFAFHDPDHDDRLSFDLGSAARAQHLAQARNELLSENLRLLYVAVTRARHRCYLVWGNINRAETSALAYLLHDHSEETGRDAGIDQTARLKNLFKHRSRADLAEDLNQLAAGSQNSIEVVSLPLATDPAGLETKPRQSEEPLFCRRFTEKIDRSWKISSYSSIISAGFPDVDLPDRDEFPETEKPTQLLPPDELERDSGYSEQSVLDFPRGARAGSFFHDIFEHYDFSERTTAPLASLVSDKLLQYGYDPKWHQTVCRVINSVLAVPLHPELAQFRLSSLKSADRLNEMEFYFPLDTVTPGTLKNAFQTIDNSTTLEQFANRLAKLSFAPCTGFMKGYIDLVFHHEGRFYLVDWKSNYLGSTLDCYAKSALLDVMTANYYILQYHIYTLALHQYLRYQQANYRYERDFGGVFYMFIRGINDQADLQHGIFYDRPAKDIIDSLGQALIPGYQ